MDGENSYGISLSTKRALPFSMGLRPWWEAFQMGEEPDLCCKNAGSTANTEVGVAYGKMRMTPSYEAATEEKLHPCFLYDPANVGNLICGSSAFSKLSLNI